MAPLEGRLVISLEQAVAAPLCTLRLADAGARVIKIERPGGETARHYDAAVQGTSAHFTWLNRGKESAVLDLRTLDDARLLARMLTRADILVSNLAPGALSRLGFDDARLSREYPRLIATSIVGYGQDTAYAGMKAYDLLVQAESGVSAVTGTPDTPSKVGVSVADIATGSSAYAAILEALIEREQTGRGRHIEMSMFDVMADWMAVPLLHHEQGGIETGRHGLAHAVIYPYGPFDCADGTILIAVQTAVEWQSLCRDVMRRPDLANHPDFATNPLRVEHREALDREISPVFAAMTCHEAAERCAAARIAWSRQTAVSDLGSHTALRRLDVTLETGATVSVPRPAGQASACGDTAKPLPRLGEHTDAIRAEFS